MLSTFMWFRDTAGLCSANEEVCTKMECTHKGAETRNGRSASGEFVHGSDSSACGVFEYLSGKKWRFRFGFEMLGFLPQFNFVREQFPFTMKHPRR